MRVIILGGYGNFGKLISKRLSFEPNLEIFIAGRSEQKAKSLAADIHAKWVVVDIKNDIKTVLIDIKPDILIHTSGPFQGQDYNIAIACIEHGCHYIDLADDPSFIEKIGRLDQAAKNAGILVVSGASSVPCFSAAIIDKYKNDFYKLDSIDYGIATAQQTNVGLATTSAILSYVGKPFSSWKEGKRAIVYGWQNLTFRHYPDLGFRLLSNCDIPDLTIFPKRYPDLKNITFRAGLELPIAHLGLWFLSWLVRFGIIKSLQPYASKFYNVFPVFNRFGSDKSAFHMEMKGIDLNGNRKRKIFLITAKSGHGLYIPCIPSVLIALKLARNQMDIRGAFPCLDLVDLGSYLNGLSDYDISWENT